MCSHDIFLKTFLMPPGAVTHPAALAISLKTSPPWQGMRLLQHPLLLLARKLCAISNFPNISFFCCSLAIVFASFHIKNSLRMGMEWLLAAYPLPLAGIWASRQQLCICPTFSWTITHLYFEKFILPSTQCSPESPNRPSEI